MCSYKCSCHRVRKQHGVNSNDLLPPPIQGQVFFLTPLLSLAWVYVQADKGQIKEVAGEGVGAGEAQLNPQITFGQVDWSWHGRKPTQFVNGTHKSCTATWWSHPSSAGHQTCLSSCSNNPLCLRKHTREGFPAWECVWICVNMGRRMIAQQITDTKRGKKCANRVYKRITTSPLDQAGQILGVQLI